MRYWYPARPDIVSEPPVAETATEARFCQDEERPRPSEPTGRWVEPDSRQRPAGSVADVVDSAELAPAFALQRDGLRRRGGGGRPGGAAVGRRAHFVVVEAGAARVGRAGRVTVTDVDVSHDKLLPVTAGAGRAGAVILTVLTRPLAGTHAETLPALSIERSWTSVVPSAVTAAEAPAVAADQVAPPLADVRTGSRPARSRRRRCCRSRRSNGGQRLPGRRPPVDGGAVGTVRSIRSVACTQFERRPAPSIAPELHQGLALRGRRLQRRPR